MKDYLERFQPEERKILEELVRLLHFSFSNRLKFLTYIYEIMKREGIPLEDLLDKLSLPEVIHNNNIQGKNKGEKIIEALFARRYPETAELIKNREYNL